MTTIRRYTLAGLLLTGCQEPTAPVAARPAVAPATDEREPRTPTSQSPAIPEPPPANPHVDAPADRAAGSPSDRPGDPPSDRPGDPPSDRPADPPSDRPADPPSDRPADPSAESAPSSAALAPLSDAQRAALLAGPEERIISRREHFTVSNEYRHDLWFPYLRGLGGVYVGVASDQNYTLMAVAGSEVGYLIDLDRQVVRLHRMYMALIAASPEPDGFLARFADAEAEATAAIVEAGLSDMSEDDRAAAREFLADNRAALRDYLAAVRASERDGHGVTWLADPALYGHMRAMVAGGRLRPINGNLAGEVTMATIAAGARALGLPVKVLYLSNAEEYLFYTPDFVANVRALPAEPGSVVLRTIHDRFEGWESCGDGDRRWNYQVQPLVDFQARLGDRKNNARTQMLARANREGVIDRVARGVSVFKPRA